jgi:acyl carrier protein
MEYANFLAVVQNTLGLDELPASLDLRLDSDLGADSLDFVELVLALEEASKTEISDEEWHDLGDDPTIRQIWALVENRGSVS